MKVFIILAILGSACATQLLVSDELEEYYTELIIKEISDTKSKNIQDALKIHTPWNFQLKDIISKVWRVFKCKACQFTFFTLFTSVKKRLSDDVLIDVSTVICNFLFHKSHDVCHGMIALNLPIFIHIIRNEPKATPAGFCALLLQDAEDSDSCSYNDPRFDWEVNLPEQINSVRNADTRDSESDSFTAVIVTDAHIDPLYEPNGVADCGEPICCRKGQKLQETSPFRFNIDENIVAKSIIKEDEKIKSDVVFINNETKYESQSTEQIKRKSEPAGYWGDYRNCDSPVWAFDDVIETIATHDNIDVVYYIGDNIDHHVWETTYELINSTHDYVIKKMRDTFGDNVLVIPAIGNHESQPVNQFAPSSVTGEKINTTWLYKALADKWDFYLTGDAKGTLLERGEFSMVIRPGLRVISLNNNVAYRYNWWVVYDPLDAKTHLDWLVEELSKAELAGEKVHILAHIPPGDDDLIYTWTREYNRIVNRFASTIAAEFNGHTHSDEFKIFYSLTDGEPISVAWGGGSATTYTNYNLNYKIATMNATTYEPENIVNYVYNLTEANLTPEKRPRWFQLYDFRNNFSVPNLSPDAVDELVYRMVTNDRHLLHTYSDYFTKLSDFDGDDCDIECQLSKLCKTVVTVLWGREKCHELRELWKRK